MYMCGHRYYLWLGQRVKWGPHIFCSVATTRLKPASPNAAEAASKDPIAVIRAVSMAHILCPRMMATVILQQSVLSHYSSVIDI